MPAQSTAQSADQPQAEPVAVRPPIGGSGSTAAAEKQAGAAEPMQLDAEAAAGPSAEAEPPLQAPVEAAQAQMPELWPQWAADAASPEWMPLENAAYEQV